MSSVPITKGGTTPNNIGSYPRGITPYLFPAEGAAFHTMAAAVQKAVTLGTRLGTGKYL